MSYNRTLYLIFLFLFSCCTDKHETRFRTVGQEGYYAKQTGQLPPEINESSGLIFNFQDSTLWTQNDGGSRAALFRVNRKGRLLEQLDFSKLKNVDWEEITKDPAGNIYIGDFGNNKNVRRDLRIYKVNPRNPKKMETICFRYADQKAFPPEKQERNYDCEAFFWYKNHLYLFSKNRGNRQVHYYVLPDTAGIYTVTPSQSNIYLQSMVTGASISPDAKKFVLLAYGKVYFFKLTDENDLFANPDLCLRMNRGQAEAIAFVSENELLFSTEQGKIFKLRLKIE